MPGFKSESSLAAEEVELKWLRGLLIDEMSISSQGIVIVVNGHGDKRKDYVGQ